MDILEYIHPELLQRQLAVKRVTLKKKSENKIWFKLAYALPFNWRLLSITVWVLPFDTTFECEHNLNATRDG